MTDASLLPLLAAARRPRLTEVEIQALGRWVRESTLPSWRQMAAPGAPTPIDQVERLIGEWTAQRAILDLVGEFAGDLGDLLKRLEGGQ